MTATEVQFDALEGSGRRTDGIVGTGDALQLLQLVGLLYDEKVLDDQFVLIDGVVNTQYCTDECE